MKTLTLNAWDEEYQVFFHTDTYSSNDNIYVGIAYYEDGIPEPWSDLTVNLGTPLPPDTAYIDTNNNADGVLEWLIENELGRLTGRFGSSGFCTYPEFQFNMEKLKEYMEEL